MMPMHEHDERHELEPHHARKLKRCLKKARNLVRSRIKARKGLGKRRYR